MLRSQEVWQFYCSTFDYWVRRYNYYELIVLILGEFKALSTTCCSIELGHTTTTRLDIPTL